MKSLTLFQGVVLKLPGYHTISIAAILCGFFLLGGRPAAYAQKSFIEGVIAYKVSLITKDNQKVSGTYIMTVKGVQLKKELKLDNGYQDVLLFNFGNNTGVALENHDGQKYAIQMDMQEILQKWEEYAGYDFKENDRREKDIAGCATNSGTVTYKNGKVAHIFYTTEWMPTNEHTFERFPGARFIPLSFTYVDGNGMSMQFVAEKISFSPVENAVFRKPADYKVISSSDYHQMMK